MALTIANKITIARILAVPFFVTAILYYSPTPELEFWRPVALGIFLFAVISDILDGYIARTRGQMTETGAILDPLADKILLVSAFVCLHIVGHEFLVLRFPTWFIVTVISRDVLLVIGAVLIWMLHGHLGVGVSIWGKAATFFQVACVVGLLLQWFWTHVLWYPAFLLTVISGFDYLIKGFYILNTPRSSGPPLGKN